MKLFNNIKNYIGEDDFRIVIYNNIINVINYDEIDEINSNKIVIDKRIIINGKNLKINKMLNKELLINGEIKELVLNE